MKESLYHIKGSVCVTQLRKELMVQLQTFTTRDYLLKKIIALLVISYKIERKNGKIAFNSFEKKQKIISNSQDVF